MEYVTFTGLVLDIYSYSGTYLFCRYVHNSTFAYISHQCKFHNTVLFGELPPSIQSFSRCEQSRECRC